MQQEEILEKLKSAGLNVSNGGVSSAVVYKTTPHYRGNYGFHSITTHGYLAIAVKNVYKDFIRTIQGSSSLSESDWSEVIKTLNTAEATLKSPLQISFTVEDNICFVQSVEICEKLEFDVATDLRDYMIPRPLTGVEYALPTSKLYDEKIMVSGGYFAEYFPRLLSPFTESVFAKIPDILNPIFVSCNIKTSSPSTVCLYNNLYINATIYEKTLKAIGLTSSLFRLKFAPQLYLKQNRENRHGNLIKSYFPVEDTEIQEIITEMNRTISNISSATVIEDSFFEFPVQFSVAYEYLDIQFQNCLAVLLKDFPTLSDGLTAVYKTREQTFFASGEKTISRCFDFSSDAIPVNFNIDHKPEPINKYIDMLPFFKRFTHSGHARKNIKRIHTLLDIRDQLYNAVSDFVLKSNQALLQIGNIAVSKGKADSNEDIFYFEHDEVKKIYHDSFFSDATQTMNFRKSQMWRFAAQPVPPEMYASDFEKCGLLSEQMIVKYLELAEFEPLALHSGIFEGLVTKNLSKTDYKGEVIAAKSLYPADLIRFETAAGFIIENASPFGFASEFAVLKNIPLYTGFRFAPLVLNGKKVKIADNKILKIYNG